MHTCRCDTDASSSGLTCTCRVATAIVETEGMGGFSVTIDGLADLGQSLKNLESDGTLKTAPTIGVTGCFQTNNHLSGQARGGGELNRAAGTAVCDCSSDGGVGTERRKGFTRGGSFGGLACWAWVLPWVLLVLGGMEGVKGVAIPDCTFPLYPVTGWNDRSCGIRKVVDDYITCTSNSGANCGGSYGPIEDWNTSLVTDMSWVFYNKGSFNANISAWDVGKATNMAASTFTLSPLSKRSGLFLAASMFPFFLFCVWH
jgi:surface protein